MRNLILAFVLLCLAAPSFAQVRVKGHFRKNGTYVAPHYRSAPNNSRLDNYSTRGNYNPYTGRQGTQPSWPAFNAPSDRQSYAPTYSAPPAQPAPLYPAEYYRAQAAMDRARMERMRLESELKVLAAQNLLLQQLREGRNPKSLGAEELFLLQQASSSFKGDQCTSDCSGHEAGYQWAEDNVITDPGDCGGNSQSFVEGCEAWAEEQAEDDESDY